MKEYNWEEKIENSKDFLESNALADENYPVQVKDTSFKSKRIVNLRRRIEERLDGKRIELEYDFNSLDELVDHLQ
ncbi:MAG: hypothetical protein QGG67_03280 [Gammaproteobacteria bacterium]|jgi:hypothetical protein|nr:hypothetical protein [Gammaproteobacteria bacterium]MDP6095010.1 hypothetical protein [Gammaproteobacteria bacterium]HJO12885.1 hypothetical protein [Gammaproteobacteria bacterium]|tara:strand:+ start:1385 stop:1609 length:225 start_codon:yes stop_codon:yes gene_type:complete